MARVHRLLSDQPESVEHGYPIYFDVFSAMARGDLDGAVASARRMQELGRRFGDPNLVALGVLGEGRALFKQGRVDEAWACWTRRCWRRSPTSCIRSGPGGSTAT